MFRSAVLVFALLFVSACITSLPPKGGVTDAGEKVYLSPIEEIPKAIEIFSKSQDLTNEESVINYLLSRILKSKYSFVRNNSDYTGSEASEFLRWKLNRPRWRPLIRTAQDFVIIVSKGSIESGLPYEVVLPNQNHHELKAVLINEYDFLMNYLEQKKKSSIVPAITLSEPQKKSNEKTKGSIPVEKRQTSEPSDTNYEMGVQNQHLKTHAQ